MTHTLICLHRSTAGVGLMLKQEQKDKYVTGFAKRGLIRAIINI